MGFLDKVKEQAQQAVQQAQQGVAQGHAKLTELQVRRQADALLRDLGAAYYAEQRAGGPPAAVRSALAAVDAHVTAHGPVDTTPTAPPDPVGSQPPTTTPGAPSAGSPMTPPAPPPAGSPMTPPAPPPAGSPVSPPAAQGGATAATPPAGNFSLDDL